MKRGAFGLLFTFWLLSACTSTQTGVPGESALGDRRETSSPDFVGSYDGSSFETAMGMRLNEDGTFRWALAVGALDLSAAGTWQRDGSEIVLQSDPVPIPPEFRVLGMRDLPDQPMVKVILPNGKPFEWASLRLHCQTGEDSFHQIYAEGWSPEIERRMATDADGVEYDVGHICADPLAISISQSNYEVRTGRLELDDLGWKPGSTIVVEFRPNDLGVKDFTGARGRLRDGTLVLATELGPLELRKVAPDQQEPRN